MNSAQEAKNAILRGEDIQVAANLGQISNQLDVASELGVGPTQTPREQTPATASVSPVQYQTSPINPVVSPTNKTNMQSQIPLARPLPPMQAPPLGSVQMQPAHTIPSMQAPVYQSMMPNHMSQMPMPSMQLPPLPPLPQQQMPSISTPQMQQPSHMPMGLLPPIQVDMGMRSEPVSAGPYMSQSMLPPAPPPLVHSHSFPNGMPNQATFANTVGIGHPPHTSSPLATMPVSRPPSPKLAVPEVQRTASDSNTLQTPRRPSLSDARANSDSRADGLPIARGRSSSVNKAPRGGIAGMTSSVPPSAWQSRATSPEEDDDSEEEGPRRTKRRRSSAGEKNDPSMAIGAMISEDMRRQLDRIFEDFLQKVCSDCE